MANNLWAAFIADNGSNDILVASSANGATWTPSVPINQTSPFTPSLALFNGSLYVAFITNDVDSATGVPSNRIFLCSTTDGVSWSSATFFRQYSKCAPSLAVWNGKLHIAFVANDPSNTLLVYYSSTPDDPTSWSATVATNQTSANAPSLAAYTPAGQTQEQLFLAFVAENGSQDIFVCSLASGGSWSSANVTKQSCDFSPSLAVFGSTLYLAFVATNGSNDLLLCSLNTNGIWSSAVSMSQSSLATPSVISFGPNFCAGFLANDPGGQVLVASTSNAASWKNGDVYTQQQSAAGPSIAVAPFPCCYQLVPANARPLVGNSNYFLYGGALTPPIPNLLNLKVVIELSGEVVCGQAYIPGDPGAGATQGFDFQLNTYCPIGDVANRWQQFVISFQTQYTGDGTVQTPIPALSCSIETFGTSSFNAHLPGSDGKVPGYFPVNAANAQTLPSGYVFTIILSNDSAGNVIQADFEAVDTNNGKSYSWSFTFGSAGQPIPGGVASSETSNGQLVFGPNAAAGIASFQLNICGVNGNAFMPFTAIDGMITYTSTTPMTVDDNQPDISTSQGGYTGENSNCVFGQLPACPSQTFVQPFFLPPSS
jgi:hypothetical protein